MYGTYNIVGRDIVLQPVKVNVLADEFADSFRYGSMIPVFDQIDFNQFFQFGTFFDHGRNEKRECNAAQYHQGQHDSQNRQHAASQAEPVLIEYNHGVGEVSNQPGDEERQ